MSPSHIEDVVCFAVTDVLLMNISPMFKMKFAPTYNAPVLPKVETMSIILLKSLFFSLYIPWNPELFI